MNQVILTGRLVRDAELRYIQTTGTATLNFTLACDRDYKKKDRTKEADFINVQMVGPRCEKLAQYLVKGALVGVTGSLRVNNYKDRDGNSKSFTFVNCGNLEFMPTGAKKSNDNFVPPGLDPNGFEAIDDSDVPF